MLPRLYAHISATPRGDPIEEMLLKSARHIRAIILAPAAVLAWAFGIFLFGAYFVSDWERPLLDLVGAVPAWFWVKLTLVVGLSGYHGFLAAQGRRLAAGERPHTVGFWGFMSVAPFLIAVGAVLLATLEP